MNILKNLKTIIYNTCLYFTVAEFAILIAATAIMLNDPVSSSGVKQVLNLTSAAILLLVSFIMSALNLIFKINCSQIVKVLLHFIGSSAAFAVLLLVSPDVYGDIARVITLFSVFAVVYFIIAFIALIIITIKNNRRADQLEYENKFDSR